MSSPQRPRRGRAIRRLVILLAVLGLGSGVIGGLLYHRHVVAQPGPHLTRHHVLGVIAQESPVYYRDGTTRIGVFFEDEHRDFVPWERIPLAYAAAIVAAEDERFWSHPGFDLVGIARAMRDNLSAGALVSGGSTLTQQTAKNLYYRPDRSLRSKLVEGLNALRLEAHFSKPEILTFYANQFHVAGNGRGLGIAARHFFDQPVQTLDLAQAAFLAGLVKAPARYDPFSGDEARRGAARDRAAARTRYVLRRITEVAAERLAGPWPASRTGDDLLAFDRRVEQVRALQAEARVLLEEDLDLGFRRGTFRYDSSAVLDEVARRLAEPPFADVLEAAGVEDPATAGLKVITTLDPVAERAAIYGLWHHLTDVGLMLEDRGNDAFVRQPDAAPRYEPERVPEAWTFRSARIEAHTTDASGRRTAQVDLGGHSCTLDRDAFVRAAVAVERGRVGSPSAKTSTAAVDHLVDHLAVGTIVWVSVREVGDDGARCDLEVRPELQGAVVVLEDGRVRAMVGGHDNRNFNRASALRQFGSTWKPVVYHAAMELGWRPDDWLDNRRGVFPFSTTAYWPSPDHEAPDVVSLAWAGVRSENLASVWLLYHLTDRLDASEVAELAEQLGLARGEEESADAYRLRIQQAGVLSTPSRIRESLYLQARREVVGAVARGPHPEDALGLASLLYGWGFEKLRREAGTTWQQEALSRSWLEVSELRRRCSGRYAGLAAALDAGISPPLGGEPALSFRRQDGTLHVACGRAPDGYGPLTPELVEPDRGWLGILPRRVVLAPESDLRVGDALYAATIDAVASAVQRRELAREVAGAEAPGPYDPEILYDHQDFRVLLGMELVTSLAQRYGVRTELNQVLSLPLGASEVTLEELTMVYDGLTSGQTWRFDGIAVGPEGHRVVGEPLASTLLIEEIRDVDDRILYRATPEAEEVATPVVGAMTLDVLRQVVTRGTGRRALAAATVGGAPLPVGGKTGTTNAFRNAAFLGVAPSVTGRRLDHGVAVGVYVGYDDNRSMVNGSVRLDGSRGALPAWVTTVRGLAAGGVLGDVETAPPRGGWSLEDPPGTVRVAVDPVLGGLPAEGPDLPQILSVPPAERPALAEELERVSGRPRRPVRIAPRTLDLPAILEEQAERARRGEGAGVWRRPERREGRQP